MKKALHIITAICLLAVLTWLAPEARAFAPETYTQESVLASGRWVQISVGSTGPHRIPAYKLAEWGFRNPQVVRIFGYGAAIIPDYLSAETYIDDLPPVPALYGPDGIVFYAVGPVTTAISGTGDLVHQVNPYTTTGYYYLTEIDEAMPDAHIIAQGGDPADDAAASTEAKSLLLHEEDLTSPSNMGRLLVGEDFVYVRSQNFTFDMADRVESTPVRLVCSFMAGAPSSSTIVLSANDAELPYSIADRIPAASGTEVYGALANTVKTFVPEGQRLKVNVTHQPTGVVNRANLDYLEVNYTRTLRAPEASGLLWFSTDNAETRIENGAGLIVWDVTDQLSVRSMSQSAGGAWRNRYSGRRLYVAFNPSASLPQPESRGVVANQNLHATPTPDMVIITPSAYAEAAERLARFHRENTVEPLTVEVLRLDKVLHEFGSGSFDPGALRRCLKMLYDRGPLRFALMMGKGTFDNRCVTSVGKAMRAPMPIWVSEASLTESSAYSTDDYLAYLDDNSGMRPSQDKLSIALGRIPCTTPAEAALAVDKIEQYHSRLPRSDWRNKVLILADDGNRGIHMTQSESLFKNAVKASGDKSLLFDKVYIDAYDWQNGSYPIARSEFYRRLNDGTMLWVYVGHGSPTALCGDNMVTYLDMSTQFFLRHWPFCYAATCSFLKWDTDITSAAEMLYFTSEGGIIGAVSALRPVYISYNGDFTAAFGTELATRNPDGLFPTMGEVYQRAKNRLSDDNRLRFVYMGDPALRTVLPSASVRLDSVNGVAVTPDAQVTLPARGRLTLSGTVLTPAGQIDTGFNGRISATLFDADRSVVSMGHGEDGEQVPFDVHGDMLLMAGGSVSNGEFSFSVQMPSDVADNFRPATLNLYAWSEQTDASGVCRDLYVYGYDAETPADDTAPVIHSMVLNHESFSDGDRVNTAPMLLASISDDCGINLSGAGVGHQITLTVDGATQHSDVSGYFTPDAEPVAGAMSGTIAYPIPEMAPGRHSMKLRVWDISGNYAERTIECVAEAGIAPKIFDVYTDTNPASVSASFYVTHNRPDERLTVEVTVYNLLGQPVWSASSTGRSDMHTSAPLRWDLTDNAGRRVNRGIYLYRATITEADGSRHSTASRKIAVTSEP